MWTKVTPSAMSRFTTSRACDAVLAPASTALTAISSTVLPSAAVLCFLPLRFPLIAGLSHEDTVYFDTLPV